MDNSTVINNITLTVMMIIFATVICALLLTIYKMHSTHTRAMVIIEKDFLNFIRTRPVVRIRVNSDKDTVFQPIERAPVPLTAEAELRRTNLRRDNEENLYGGVPG